MSEHEPQKENDWGENGPTVGTRVTTIVRSNSKEVVVFGEGTYIGDGVPPEDASSHAYLFHLMDEEMGMIELDSGGTAYMGECFIGTTEEFKECVKGRTVTQTTLAKEREDFAQSDAKKQITAFANLMKRIQGP